MPTYRPLPRNIIIKKSKIDGIGIHATEDIPSATLLGLTHIQYRSEWFRSTLGGYINHSDTPNAVIIDKLVDAHPERYLYSVKPIKSGEEITIFYTLYQVK